MVGETRPPSTGQRAFLPATLGNSAFMAALVAWEKNTKAESGFWGSLVSFWPVLAETGDLGAVGEAVSFSVGALAFRRGAPALALLLLPPLALPLALDAATADRFLVALGLGFVPLPEAVPCFEANALTRAGSP